VKPGALTDEHNFGGRTALSGHDIRPRPVQSTFFAGPQRPIHLLQ